MDEMEIFQNKQITFGGTTFFHSTVLLKWNYRSIGLHCLVVQSLLHCYVSFVALQCTNKKFYICKFEIENKFLHPDEKKL